MKPILFIVCLQLLTQFVFGAEDHRLAEAKALAFDSIRSVAIASVGAPTKTEPATFHGNAVKSHWADASDPEGITVATELREMINREVEKLRHPADSDWVTAEPFGFVHGEFGLRVETGEGLREFSIGFQDDDAFIYAYDSRKHSLYLHVEGAVAEMLRDTLPNKAPPPPPPSHHSP